jgi:hypothetical protein
MTDARILRRDIGPKIWRSAALDHGRLVTLGWKPKVATDGLLCPQVIRIAVRNHGVSDLKVQSASVVELELACLV